MIYIGIDEGYEITKFKSLKDIVRYAGEDVTHKDGSKVTVQSAAKELKEKYYLYLYEYGGDVLESMRAGNDIASWELPDWHLKIVKL